jgi:putative hydrolase of the HAD superfamily
MNGFSVKAEDCLYVGDGGSEELETASKLGMRAVQAAWYLQEGTTQPSARRHDFIQLEQPLEVVLMAVNEEV